MKKLMPLVVTVAIICSSRFSHAEEKVVGYVPSPEGDYVELSSTGRTVLATGSASTARVGIGTTTPNAAAKLDVAGKIRMADGTQAANRVLTSDTAGVARWSDLPPQRATGIINWSQTTVPGTSWTCLSTSGTGRCSAQTLAGNSYIDISCADGKPVSTTITGTSHAEVPLGQSPNSVRGMSQTFVYRSYCADPPAYP